MTTPTEGWPLPERLVDEDLVDTRVVAPSRQQVETTAVYAPSPAVAPPGRSAADRIGYELLAGIALVALAGAVVAVWLLSRDQGNTADGTTTVVVTTTARPTPAGATARAFVVMPSLVGSSRTDAAAVLRSAGVRSSVRHVPGAAPVGTVLAQSPPPGAHVARSGIVSLSVSTGPAHAAAARPATTLAPTSTSTPETPTTTAKALTPEPTSVQVPNLSGDVKSAVQNLSRGGLRASLQYVPGTAVLGTVTAQSPQPDTRTRTGAHVTLSLSSGPGQKQQENVPDVVGQRIPAALQTLNGAGLRLILLKRTVAEQSQAGTIVEQTPRPGARAPKNAQVLVYMGAFRG